MAKYDVVLPESVIALIDAARGPDEPDLPLEEVLGQIIGALPFLAVALHGQMTEQEYRYFQEIVKLQMADARRVIYAKNPPLALKKLLADTRKRFKALNIALPPDDGEPRPWR